MPRRHGRLRGSGRTTCGAGSSRMRALALLPLALLLRTPSSQALLRRGAPQQQGDDGGAALQPAYFDSLKYADGSSFTDRLHKRNADGVIPKAGAPPPGQTIAIRRFKDDKCTTPERYTHSVDETTHARHARHARIQQMPPTHGSALPCLQCCPTLLLEGPGRLPRGQDHGRAQLFCFVLWVVIARPAV